MKERKKEARFKGRKERNLGGRKEEMEEAAAAAAVAATVKASERERERERQWIQWSRIEGNKQHTRENKSGCTSV